MTHYSTYRRFLHVEEAEACLVILKENNLPFQFIGEKRYLDPVLFGKCSDDLYELHIPADQFLKADEIIFAGISFETPEQQYYLYSFADRELEDILQRPDEWSNHDYRLARKLLEERQITFTDQQLLNLKFERWNKLARPVREKLIWILVAYTLMLMAPFWAWAMGLALSQAKKTVPDGRKVNMFDKTTRLNGQIISIMSLLLFGFTFFTNLDIQYSHYTGLLWINTPQKIYIETVKIQ